jgi:hypothetical protein
MPFGINFGKTKTASQSTSAAASDAFGFSTSLSESGQESGSEVRSKSTSTQAIAFADLYQQLYGGALGAAGKASLALPGLQSQASSLFSAGKGFLDEIGGDAGRTFLDERIRGDDDILATQLAGLQEDVGRFFSEELLPGVTSAAVGAGQLGGGRQGVAQGRAIDTAAREFRRGSTELRLADRTSRENLAMGVAGLDQAGRLGGAAALPGLFGLAEAGTFAGLGIQERLAALFGGPTTLTTSEAQSTSDAFSVAEAIAQSFSADVATSRSTSQSTSAGKGKTFGFTKG